jgi:hypothetical protein
VIPELAVLGLFALCFVLVSMWRFAADAPKQPLSE